MLNIDKLINEIIKTKEGKYYTILEVSSINFTYKSEDDKEMIIANFESYLKLAPIRFRFKILSRIVDTNKYIDKLYKDFKADPSTGKKMDRYRKDYVNLISRTGRREGIERQFLLILEYCDTPTQQASNEADIVDSLRYFRNIAAKYLKGCGNEVIVHQNESDFVLETLFSITNKEKSVDDFWNYVEDIKDSVVEYYENDEEQLSLLPGYFNNICAPDQVDFYRDYCRVNNTFYTFLLIPSFSYPTYVPFAWLSFLINYAEGVDLDIWVEKKHTPTIREKIRRRQRVNGARMKDLEKTDGQNTEAVLSSLQASQFLRESLSNGEDFFYFNILITISAYNVDDLQRKQMSVRDKLSSLDIDTLEPSYMVDLALKSYMPTQPLDSKFFEKSKRNITTSGLAAMYPFTSFEVSDDDGILLGVSKDNSSMVVADNFNQKKYSNANMVILGTSGAGKTFTMQTMCMRHRLKGTPVYVITPDKGEEWELGAKALGGSYVNIASGSQNRINIMEIRPVESEYTDERFISRRQKNILLNQKIENLSTFFSLIMPDLSAEEQQLLDDAVIQTYKSKGITKDNKSLIDHYETIIKDDKKVKKVVYKEMPILEDLYNILKKNERTQRIAILLNKYVHGSASSFNGQTNVDLSNKYVVVDITDLSDELQPVGMFVALEYIWDKVREDKTKKKIVAIDEAWELISTNESAALFVKKIYKLIRGYGGAALTATQNIADFFALKNGVYGEAIINNSRIKLLLKLESKEVDKIKNIFDLSDEEASNIKTFERGQMLVKSNSNTFTINYTASPYEILLTTTDRSLLEKIAKGETITEHDLAA